MPSCSREIGSPDTALVEGVPRRDCVASRIENTSLPLSPRQTGKPNLGKDPVRTREEVELIPSQGREAFTPLHGKLHENLSRDSFGVHKPPPTTLSWPRSRPPGEDLRSQSGCWALSTAQPELDGWCQDCLALRALCCRLGALQALSRESGNPEGRDF